MLDRKVIVEYINIDDVLNGISLKLSEKYTGYFEGIEVRSAEVERYFDSHGNVVSEEVTIWLTVDDDIYNLDAHSILNEITVEVPMGIIWGLDDLTDALIKKMSKRVSKLVKY